MIETNELSVRDLLPDKFDRLESVMRDELSSSEAVGKATFPNVAWQLIESEAAKAIADSLDCDAYELLARAWCLARELHEYTVEEKHPPGQRSILYLGEHKLATYVHPVITVTIGGIKCPPVRFTLELTAIFHSIALSICDGRIRSVSAGDCLVSAQLKYKEIKLHHELQSRKVSLPGRHNFPEPGLEII